MSGIGPNPLNPLSKIYLECISENKKDDTYLEPDMKKRQKNNEKARKELAKGPQMKNPHFEEKQQGWDTVNSLFDTFKAMQEEGYGAPGHNPGSGEKSVARAKALMDKKGQKGAPGLDAMMAANKEHEARRGVKKEGLDPVGKEDGDVNNDGKKDKTDKYLMNRRKAIGKAIKGKMSNMKKEETDVDKYIETVAKVKESERKNDVQRWVQKESSNWRQDLSEIMTDDVDSKPIKEKSVKNKIKINPKLGEAVEEMGGELIEMSEISEYEYMVQGLRQELIDEGHDPEAVNYALQEAKVTMGHDTPGNKEGTRDKLKKKAKGFLGKVAYKGYHAARDAKRAASPMLQRIKTSAKRGVRKAALKVADKLKEESVDEAMSSYDRNRKRAAQRAADRNAARAAGKTGVVPGVGYVTARKEKETYTDEKGTVRHKSGAKNEEVEQYVDFLIAEGYDCSELTWDDMSEEYSSLDEGLRSAVKKLFGGKKKEEPAKPMSRGDELRKKYNVGPEKSDTSAKAQILKRTRAKAERDQKEFGGSRYSKGVADRSKAAHERQLKGGYSKYGADDARGSGNKARKRAAALTKEEVENVEELYKGKHGQTEKQYQDSRSDAGKMVSGDSKMSGSKYAQGRRTGSDAGPQPAGGSQKPASQGKMDRGSRIDLQFRKAALRKEDAAMSPQEIALQKRKAMLDRMIAQKRHQGLSKVKKSEAPAKAMGEETEDSLRDRRMERGGVDGNNRYKKPVSNTPNTFGKKKPKYDGMSALEKVKASIRAKHGEGAIKEDAKMAKQSDEKLAALHKQVSGSDQSLPSNQFMMKRVTKEMNRRKKAT